MYSEKQSNVLESDIRVIEAEQKNRIISKDAEGKKKINAINGEICKVHKKMDDVICFKMKVRTSMLSVRSSCAYLDEDSGKRKLTSEKDLRKHKDYLDMVEKSKALDDIDLYKESPSEILKRMQEAKAAGVEVLFLQCHVEPDALNVIGMARH